MPTASSRPLPNERTRWRIAILCFAWLIGFAASIFLLPYAIPTAPTIGLSYLAGYSNRFALIAFVFWGVVLGGLVLHLFPVRIPRSAATDSPLPWWSALACCIGLCLWCGAWVGRGETFNWGGEVMYAMDRLVHLGRGETLYRDFEFAYGPLMLYLPLAVHKALPLSLSASFFLCWIVEWCAGVFMLWYIVAKLETPIRLRWALFAFVFCMQLLYLPPGGATTTLRLNTAAFFAVWLYRLPATRWHFPAFALAVIACFAVSPEQGAALALGWIAYVALKAFQSRIKRSLSTIAAYAAVALVITAPLYHWGMFRTMAGFSRGGYSYPLLPSVLVILFLCVYLSAIVHAARALRSGPHGVTQPVVLVGLPLLGAALGRCDVAHLAFNTPLIVVGLLPVFEAVTVATITWLPLACWMLFWPIAFSSPTLTKLSSATGTFYTPTGADQVCYVTAMQCDTGFFFGTVNMITPTDVQKKYVEIASRSHAPMMLQHATKAATVYLWPSVAELPALRDVEHFPLVPKQRHEAVRVDAIQELLEQSLVPTNQHVASLTVWTPR